WTNCAGNGNFAFPLAVEGDAYARRARQRRSSDDSPAVLFGTGRGGGPGTALVPVQHTGRFGGPDGRGETRPQPGQAAGSRPDRQAVPQPGRGADRNGHCLFGPAPGGAEGAPGRSGPGRSVQDGAAAG